MRIPVGLELRALDSIDAERVRAWRNDHRVWRWCRQLDLISDVAQRGWFERQAQDPSIRMYSVWLKIGDGGDLVGVCGLTSLDFVNRRAEFSLYVAPEKHRQGLGRAALTLLLDHAFANLGLDQVFGEVFDGNPALALFAELGFQLDGKRRAWYYKESRAWDAHLISITRSEWNGRHARSAPLPNASHAGGDALPAETEGGAAVRKIGGKAAKRRATGDRVAGGASADAEESAANLSD